MQKRGVKRARTVRRKPILQLGNNKSRVSGICEKSHVSQYQAGQKSEASDRRKNSNMLKGFSFGLTSGVITTLGMIVGLHSATHSLIAVLGGILSIAVADAFSDAFGVHVSEESENSHNEQEIWAATFMTFMSKLIFALTFIIPFLIFPESTAIWACIIWGSLLITVYSLHLASQQNKNKLLVVGEHLLITLIVVTLTHFVGDLIALLQ